MSTLGYLIDSAGVKYEIESVIAENEQLQIVTRSERMSCVAHNVGVTRWYGIDDSLIAIFNNDYELPAITYGYYDFVQPLRLTSISADGGMWGRRRV